jgi:hypothetical protein
MGTGTLDTLTPDQQLEAVYVGYYSRAADAGGFSYWEAEYANLVAGGDSDSQAITQIANEFGPPQAETLTTYPQFNNMSAPFNINSTSETVAVTAFVNAVYENVFNRPLATGDTYWVDQILNNQVTLGEAILFIENGAIGADATTLLNKIAVASDFTSLTGAAQLGFGASSTYPAGFLTEAHSLVLNTTSASTGPGSVASQENLIAPYIQKVSQPGATYTLTANQDTLVGTTGNDTFNAPLVTPSGGQTASQPTLTSFDSLTGTFSQGVAYSVLNASFDGSAKASGLNIVNIPVWNIQNIDSHYGTVTLTGDGPSGPSNIDGLTTLNYNANSGGDSLLIGDNSEPVQTGNGGSADGFQINVSNALGNGHNGVDVDIWAGDFAKGDTIDVTAAAVGGFTETNGSYNVPDPITGTIDDVDSYNPNWVGYGRQAYAISAGASAGPDGPVGFTNWVVSSTDATAIGSLNIIALGGEGSTSATSLTLTDDGSNTILYATSQSDSLLSDWENLTTINLSGTSGFVTLTGAEATAAEGGSSGFASHGFGGLLTDVGLGSTGLTITGGSGNSFYDLSSMTLAAAHASSIDGGHSTAGNSEVAFNNSVIANASASNVAGTTVAISHIQILDDASSTQGGDINMNDFAGLQGLNADYALISQDNATTATGQTVVPDGLPFTSTTSAIVEAGAAAAVAGLSNDVIPTGYQVLQLLNNEGSTATTQTSDLFIYNGPTQFAINAQDVANGWPTLSADQSLSSPYSTPFDLSGHNLTVQGEYVGPSVSTTDTLRYYVSDDGVNVFPTTSPESTLSHTPAPEFTLSDTPVVQVLNYTNVDFFLPYESIDSAYANWVVLGSTSFTDAPVVLSDANGSFQNATLSFYDNTTDTGGSDPGGADSLALGHTNLVVNPGQLDLGVASIGYDTVQVDANAITTTINDHGAGVFEIGATDATTLIATSTSHLIQDVSATLDYFTANDLAAPSGIAVDGSLTGQNLEQGTSGYVSDTGSGGSASVGIGGNGVTGGPLGDVLQVSSAQPHVGENGSWGNDVLNGGAGGNGVAFYETGGALQTYTGNSGDNFFPEGGNDTVNIGGLNTSGAAIGASNATVWFGAYDVSNSGDYLGINSDSGVGHIYGQAITQIVNGAESYVDGYGPGELVTINGFQPYVGSTGHTGDIINLDAPDWATGKITNVSGVKTENGLVQADGTSISGGANVLHNADATTFEVGSTTGLSSTVTNTHANLILDAFGTYANSQQLVAGLESSGAFLLPTISANTSEHLLVAYQNTTGGVNIDDVTLTNTGSHGKLLPSTAELAPTATDMITITGVSLAQLETGHNFHFV